MKIPIALKRLSAVMSAAILALVPAAAQNATHVVISQVYGGGGNSGAPFTNDFVELYNPTSSTVTLTGMTLQYASAANAFQAGTSYNLTGTILPGHYFLIQGAAGATTFTALPAPDQTIGLNLSATAGKVALVSNSTLIGTACSGTAVVDEASYGSTASCYEGTGAAPAPANPSSIVRKTLGVDTDNNATDFIVLNPPVPHNSSYTGSTSTTSLGISSATANPASVTAGSPTTLTVMVNPGSTSTGIAVTANLSSVGGSTAQSLTLGSTNTYTYTLNVGSGVSGSFTLPVSVTDQQAGTASGSIALTVTVPVVNTPISTIQANRSTYVGQNVTFSGIVTMVTGPGYYLQTASSTPGSTGDEGIYVYSGTGRNPAGAVVGNNVSVTGFLTIYPLATVSHTPSLEVTGASLTLISTGNALPKALAVAAPTANGGIYQLTPYESMRVTFPSVTSTGPTDANLTEATETNVSSGQFYAVVGATPRPFREPGMDFRDFPSATCPSITTARQR